MITNTGQNWRRLTPLFLATTLVPAVCLCWLGWKVVGEDRRFQQDRVKEQSEQAANLAESGLKRTLAEAEERLANFSAAPAAARQDAVEDGALIAFGLSGSVDRAGTLLPYYPVVPESREPDPARFAAVDELEFQKKDLMAALRALEGLTIGGDVLLRRAAIQRKLGNTSRALDAFAELGKLDAGRVGGVPAVLLSRQGRALIFESTKRDNDLQFEAAAICDDLESGRWIISRGVFVQSDAQCRLWLASVGATRPPMDPERLALAEAADSVWRDWQVPGAPSPNGRSRRTLQVGDVSVLLLTRWTPEQRTALLVPPRFLESAWLSGLRSAGQAQQFDFALTDLEGRAVLGRPAAQPSVQAVHLAAATQLPWTLHVVSRGNGPPAGLSGQTKLVLAGIVMMALLALAGGLLINRSLLRELRVARLQSDFVAAVSHEFRTPLTTVRQLAEMLTKGRVSSDARRQQFYETLLKESERLQKLVEGLLDFGRMEAGQLEYRFESVDPEQFVRDIVSDFEREVAGRGYHVELHGNGLLPPIRADRASLARVFWNLLDNAVKYSPESRIVWVDVSEVGRRLAVRVRDRGIGIPAPEQKEIFKKFVRGAASKNASIQGTGVGLAMARQIVEAHGGDISVESQPGEGSVFTVLLPVAET